MTKRSELLQQRLVLWIRCKCLLIGRARLPMPNTKRKTQNAKNATGEAPVVGPARQAKRLLRWALSVCHGN